MDYIERINEFGKQTLREKTMFDEDMIENMYTSTDDFTFYAEDAINHGIATDMICK